VELTHVRLLVTKFAECFRFYRDTLGLPTQFPDDGGPYAEFDLGGDTYLGLFDRAEMLTAIDVIPRALEVREDWSVLVLRVPDADQAEANLRAAGVGIAMRATDRPDWGLRTVHVRDPDGNLIELWSPYEGGDA
jgi:catechol 2,3-dioxygenase-like lactoylglutathione lyase family enzyme